MSVNFTGTYSFSFVPNAKSNYGVLTVSGNLDTIAVTLQVTFSSAVASWVDLYLPGGFNGWSTSAIMTPNAGRTAFTYYLGNVVPNSYEYQLVACYHSQGFGWTTYLDSTNQSLTIADGDSGSTKTIRSNLAAPNMPQEYAANGAVIQLTMSERVNASINVYFVGLLTSWGNGSENLASALMTPNAGRTIFTWNVPEETPIGSSEYKIVAMYASSGATSPVYDYVLKDDGNGNNATITLDTSTLTYSLSSSVDLRELGAIAFSRDFISAMATPCASQNANNKSAVSAIWGTHKSAFEALTSNSKTAFGSSEDDYVVQAKTLYLHCVSRYSLAVWTGAPESSRAFLNTITIVNSASTITIVSISIVAISATGAFFFLRKKKAR